MPAFLDATCPRCKKRIGWTGELKDRPPCPKCGHQLSSERLKKDQEYLDRFKEELAKGTYRKKDPDMLDVPPPVTPPELPEGL